MDATHGGFNAGHKVIFVGGFRSLGCGFSLGGFGGSFSSRSLSDRGFGSFGNRSFNHGGFGFGGYGLGVFERFVFEFVHYSDNLLK